MSNAILNLPQGVLDYLSKDLDLVRNQSALEDAIFNTSRIFDYTMAMESADVISAVQRAVVTAAAVDALRDCIVRNTGR